MGVLSMTLTRKFIVLGLIMGLATLPMPAATLADQSPQVIKITAAKFQFTPNQITLTKGQPVTLELTSTDVTHGFMIRALKLDQEIKPGKVTDVTVTPATSGTFKAICDHYCGLAHGGMKMTVVIKEATTTTATH
jgi:cytochrome c oxidase subunit 2